MSEQQRIFLAVALCVLIFAVWQSFLPPPAMPVSEPASAGPGAQTEPEARTAAGTASPTLAGDEGSPSGDSPQAAEKNWEEERRSFESPSLVWEMSNASAALTRLELRRYQETIESGVNRPVSLMPDESGDRAQAELLWRWNEDKAPSSVPLVFDSEDSQTLRGEHGSLGLVVAINPSEEDHALNYRVSVSNTGDGEQRFEPVVRFAMRRSEEEAGFFQPGVVTLDALCYEQGTQSLERTNYDSAREEPLSVVGDIGFAAVDRQYFVLAAHAADAEQASCAAHAEGDYLLVDLSLGSSSVAAGATWSREWIVYAGPKRDPSLEAVSPVLREIIDYTMLGIPLGFIARPMIFLMDIFHGWTSSWGVAIILLTLAVKLVLFPVTLKSSLSMRRMQLLKPELDALKEKWPDDRERQQTEQLKLFKEKGVNPLGGCLPMLLQMPVWFALYRMLWTAVDLYQQPFLWLPDLTAKEPGIPTLALAWGVVTFFQQKFTPTAAGADTMQTRMMRWMPLLFVFFFLGFPSGLVLYMLVNGVLTMAQQILINRRTQTL